MTTSTDAPEIAATSTQSPIGVGMLFALGRLNKPVYGGTVPFSTVAKRRATNRAARRSRRINRKRG